MTELLVCLFAEIFKTSSNGEGSCITSYVNCEVNEGAVVSRSASVK